MCGEFTGQQGSPDRQTWTIRSGKMRQGDFFDGKSILREKHVMELKSSPEVLFKTTRQTKKGDPQAQSGLCRFCQSTDTHHHTFHLPRPQESEITAAAQSAQQLAGYFACGFLLIVKGQGGWFEMRDTRRERLASAPARVSLGPASGPGLAVSQGAYSGSQLPGQGPAAAAAEEKTYCRKCLADSHPTGIIR